VHVRQGKGRVRRGVRPLEACDLGSLKQENILCSAQEDIKGHSWALSMGYQSSDIRGCCREDFCPK
jgi:hypothetical protein